MHGALERWGAVSGPWGGGVAGRVRAWMLAGAVALGVAACGGGGDAAEAVAPPVITAPPLSLAVDDGQGARFEVTAVGTGLSYRWQRNGTDLPGQTGSSHALTAASLADDGARYRVVVANAGGQVTSAEAVLTVRPVAPALTVAPAATQAVVGATARFSVSATGSGPLAYQWLRDGIELPGATEAGYTTPVLSAGDDGAVYSVRISGPGGQLTSAGAALTVVPAPVAPTLLRQPASLAVAAGGTASFEVEAGGSPPLRYQWRRDGVAIDGATANRYTTPPVTEADQGARFSVVVANDGGQVASTDAVLTVLAPPATSGQARLALGSAHAVAVRADGSVLAWGSNAAGQLGDGPALAGSAARVVATSAAAVAAGQFESLALGSDGVVRGWGRKMAGTTIIGGSASVFGTDQPAPGPTGYPGGVTHLATAGPNFGFVRRSDGTLWHVPSLGPALPGATVDQQARQVAGLTDAAALGAAAGGQGLPTAIGADGRVWRITFDSLDVTTRRASATPVDGLSGIVATACGGDSVGCLALAADGQVWSWTATRAPARVDGLPMAAGVAMTTGSWHVLGADGSVWSWGDGARSGIAGRQTAILGAPERVTGLGPVAEIAGGTVSVLVRLRDGSVRGWGLNATGELGTGTAAAAQTPVQAPGIQLN